VAHISGLLNRLANHVVLFQFGNLVFVTFGLFVALGAAVSLAGAGTILIGQGLGGGLFLAFALGGSAAVVGGSWFAGVILDYRLVLRQGWRALRRPIFVSWGGLLALPLSLAVFSVWTGFSALLILDALARTVPLGHALGRLGCLCYGCCFGRPTHGCLAITYRNPQAKAVRVAGLWGVPLHPAALYEAVLEFGVFLAVNAAAVMDVPVGVPAGLALLLYGSGRFAIEFLRDNQGRMLFAWVSVNHVLSLTVAALGGLALCVLLTARQQAPTISWAAGLEAIPWLLVAIVPSALVMFLGFAMHWRRVGHW
jgi:phosphatidylglycerol:prolipoprotein diacylglycerol transferase